MVQTPSIGSAGAEETKWDRHLDQEAEQATNADFFQLVLGRWASSAPSSYCLPARTTRNNKCLQNDFLPCWSGQLHEYVVAFKTWSYTVFVWPRTRNAHSVSDWVADIKHIFSLRAFTRRGFSIDKYLNKLCLNVFCN